MRARSITALVLGFFLVNFAHGKAIQLTEVSISLFHKEQLQSDAPFLNVYTTSQGRVFFLSRTHLWDYDILDANLKKITVGNSQESRAVTWLPHNEEILVATNTHLFVYRWKQKELLDLTTDINLESDETIELTRNTHAAFWVRGKTIWKLPFDSQKLEFYSDNSYAQPGDRIQIDDLSNRHRIVRERFLLELDSFGQNAFVKVLQKTPTKIVSSTFLGVHAFLSTPSVILRIDQEGALKEAVTVGFGRMLINAQINEEDSFFVFNDGAFELYNHTFEKMSYGFLPLENATSNLITHLNSEVLALINGSDIRIFAFSSEDDGLIVPKDIARF